jgi:cyclopropane fatty-acyl-phospholipid synthase-like methyltransferase
MSPDTPLNPAGNVWKDFFDEAAPHYLRWDFTANTAAEVNFLVEELSLRDGTRVLDVGCGVGRHAIPLAALGCAVTGIDLSVGMLREAQRAAREAGVESRAQFIQADATQVHFESAFDVAICLCEGAFTLLGAGADAAFTHDASILRCIHAALKPDGRLLLTALNALRTIRAATTDDVASGRFDPLTTTQTSQSEAAPGGEPFAHALRERSYTPSELTLLLRSCGFAVEHVWGGTAGRWARRPVELDEIELMAVARKRY